MASIQSCLRESSRLENYSDTARLDAEILLCTAIEKDRAYLYTWPEKIISPEQLSRYQNYLTRREQGEPIAYITGYQEFWSLNIAVNPSTLIPRPETELLVELALELAGENKDKKTLLDLGTGTGAIALAIASERPQWQITALEKNPDALALAQSNQKTHRLDNVTLVLSDWFSALIEGEHRFDVIVANPPYIDKNDEHLSQGDVRFEPASALVAEQSGLDDLAHIVSVAPQFLKENGLLLVEHGYQHQQAVAEFFKQHGYSDCFCKLDLAGQPRVSGGLVKPSKI